MTTLARTQEPKDDINSSVGLARQEASKGLASERLVHGTGPERVTWPSCACSPAWPRLVARNILPAIAYLGASLDESLEDSLGFWGGRFVLPPPRGLPLGNSSRRQSCELTDCRNEPLCRVCVRCDQTTLSGLCPSRCKDFAELAKSSTKSLGFLHSVCTSSRNRRSRGGWGSGGAFGSLGAPLPEIDPQR